MNPRDCRAISFSIHALRRMFERRVHPNDVATAVRDGEVLEERPDDQPYPTCLLLCVIDGPIHVVLGMRSETGECHIITVYWPDPQRWTSDFRRRIR